ncbi:MAG: histidine phosphatase family protein [Armatimonadota bacterium]|nr:histidine phosphatase family protein [Armatimonadota bacterium]
MTATAIYLIRHAETTWNAERRFQGTLDAPLSPRGVRQVAALAAALRDVPLAAVYTSPMMGAPLSAYWRIRQHNAAYNVVEVEEGRTRVLVLNEISHLDEHAWHPAS